ncbi:hypothetical protein [Streptomyces sp. bgisy022]|uniref:hypothetical protein n=1 Tax=Streptomyces sp. bgisy022 TaxID=3413769 RepID=UPI003D704078
MLKYEDIIDAPLAKLKAAVDDWSEMAGKLEKLATDARDGMKKKADRAAWKGVNAGVTKEFIGKTAKEFSDAVAEAKGVHRILNEGYAAIKKARADLIAIRDDEAPAAGVHVDGKGKVTPRHPLSEIKGVRRNDPDYDQLLRKERQAVVEWQTRIDLIVDNCNDTDVTLKNTLEANVTDRKDFSAPKYGKLDQEEAARAAALASKGRDLTDAQLQQLNELLKDNGESAEFARTFYNRLGPEKALAFFGQLATDTHDFGEVDPQRLKDVQDLQKNLGLNLATASHDKDFTEKWGPELRRLGTERISLDQYHHGRPFGYQLLGGIMRYGNYDAKFLNPIAEHVAQLHQKNPRLFAGSKILNGPDKNPFNPSGVNGAGYDPTTAMLEALGNSPEAAKKFFTETPTAYNEDGTVNSGATADLGKDKDGEEIENYLDFFTNEDWESFGDVNSPDVKEREASLDYMPDALGHALEAATLGYPAGVPDPHVVRDAENAAVMQQVMEKYGADPALLKQHEVMSDSLGIMGAGYIDDINWALDKNHWDSVFAPGGNPEGRIDFAGPEDGDGRSIVRGFLTALGQHPDAYATLSTAEQAYTRSVLEGTVGPDGIKEGSARAAVRVGAEVQGMLDQSRADQVEATHLKTHEDYEKAVAQRAGWVEFGATAALAAGVAFLPATAAVGAAAVLIPVATDTASGAVEQAISQFVGNVSDDAVDEHKEKVEDLADDQKKAIYSAGERMIDAPVEAFLYRNGMSRTSDFGEDLILSKLIGYGVGNDRAQQQGNAPETD